MHRLRNILAFDRCGLTDMLLEALLSDSGSTQKIFEIQVEALGDHGYYNTNDINWFYFHIASVFSIETRSFVQCIKITITITINILQILEIKIPWPSSAQTFQSSNSSIIKFWSSRSDNSNNRRLLRSEPSWGGYCNQRSIKYSVIFITRPRVRACK